MRLTSSLEIGELKKTNALHKYKGKRFKTHTNLSCRQKYEK
jgi:hypothetical protein